MRQRLWALTLLPVALWGCGQPPLVRENDRHLSRMLCEVGEQRVTLSPRLAYDLPGPLRHTACGTLKSGFNYDKRRDVLSVSTAASFREGSADVLAASLFLVVESLMDGQEPAALYPPEAFLQAKLAAMDLTPSKARPEAIEWRTVEGLQCLRFFDQWHSPGGVREEELRYWCWENQSGLKQPFLVRAGQRVAEGKPGLNLDRDMLQPWFHSLTLNRLAPPALVQANAKLRVACAQAKSRYDQGLPWGDDFPDKRLARMRLQYCGY